MATDLLARVLDAHGGLDTWRRFTRVEATIVSGGLMFEMKGQPQDPTPRRMSVALQREWGSVHPFGADDQRTDFTPDPDRDREARRRGGGRTDEPGGVVRRRRPPHAVESVAAGLLQRLRALDVPDKPVSVGAAGIRGARARSDRRRRPNANRPAARRFPTGFVSHSTLQEFYFGPDLLLARHDYRVEIAGSFSAIQHISDFVEVDGIRCRPNDRLPVRRRRPPDVRSAHGVD